MSALWLLLTQNIQWLFSGVANFLIQLFVRIMKKLFFGFLHKNKIPQVTLPSAKSFSAVAREIAPLLRDNKRIFSSYGPSSGKNAEIVRWHLTLWNKTKREIIVPNNQSIKRVLVENEGLFPIEHKDLYQHLINHIDAFEAHCKDPEIRYDEHQYPAEFDLLISNSLESDSEAIERIKPFVCWFE